MKQSKTAKEEQLNLHGQYKVSGSSTSSIFLSIMQVKTRNSNGVY